MLVANEKAIDPLLVSTFQQVPYADTVKRIDNGSQVLQELTSIIIERKELEEKNVLHSAKVSRSNVFQYEIPDGTSERMLGFFKNYHLFLSKSQVKLHKDLGEVLVRELEELKVQRTTTTNMHKIQVQNSLREVSAAEEALDKAKKAFNKANYDSECAKEKLAAAEVSLAEYNRVNEERKLRDQQLGKDGSKFSMGRMLSAFESTPEQERDKQQRRLERKMDDVLACRGQIQAKKEMLLKKIAVMDGAVGEAYTAFQAAEVDRLSVLRNCIQKFCGLERAAMQARSDLLTTLEEAANAQNPFEDIDLFIQQDKNTELTHQYSSALKLLDSHYIQRTSTDFNRSDSDLKKSKVRSNSIVQDALAALHATEPPGSTAKNVNDTVAPSPPTSLSSTPHDVEIIAAAAAAAKVTPPTIAQQKSYTDAHDDVIATVPVVVETEQGIAASSTLIDSSPPSRMCDSDDDDDCGADENDAIQTVSSGTNLGRTSNADDAIDNTFSDELGVNPQRSQSASSTESVDSDWKLIYRMSSALMKLFASRSIAPLNTSTSVPTSEMNDYSTEHVDVNNAMPIESPIDEPLLDAPAAVIGVQDWAEMICSQNAREMLLQELDEQRGRHALMTASTYMSLANALKAFLDYCDLEGDAQTAMRVSNMANTFHKIGVKESVQKETATCALPATSTNDIPTNKVVCDTVDSIKKQWNGDDNEERHCDFKKTIQRTVLTTSPTGTEEHMVIDPNSVKEDRQQLNGKTVNDAIGLCNQIVKEVPKEVDASDSDNLLTAKMQELQPVVSPSATSESFTSAQQPLTQYPRQYLQTEKMLCGHPIWRKPGFWESALKDGIYHQLDLAAGIIAELHEDPFGNKSNANEDAGINSAEIGDTGRYGEDFGNSDFISGKIALEGGNHWSNARRARIASKLVRWDELSPEALRETVVNLHNIEFGQLGMLAFAMQQVGLTREEVEQNILSMAVTSQLIEEQQQELIRSVRAVEHEIIRLSPSPGDVASYAQERGSVFTQVGILARETSVTSNTISAKDTATSTGIRMAAQDLLIQKKLTNSAVTASELLTEPVNGASNSVVYCTGSVIQHVDPKTSYNSIVGVEDTTNNAKSAPNNVLVDNVDVPEMSAQERFATVSNTSTEMVETTNAEPLVSSSVRPPHGKSDQRQHVTSNSTTNNSTSSTSSSTKSFFSAAFFGLSSSSGSSSSSSNPSNATNTVNKGPITNSNSSTESGPSTEMNTMSTSTIPPVRHNVVDSKETVSMTTTTTATGETMGPATEDTTCPAIISTTTGGSETTTWRGFRKGPPLKKSTVTSKRVISTDVSTTVPYKNNSNSGGDNEGIETEEENDDEFFAVL